MVKIFTKQMFNTYNVFKVIPITQHTTHNIQTTLKVKSNSNWHHYRKKSQKIYSENIYQLKLILRWLEEQIQLRMGDYIQWSNE